MNLPKTEYTKGNCIYKGRNRVGYAKPGGRMYSFAEMSEVSGMTRTGLKRRIAEGIDWEALKVDQRLTLIQGGDFDGQGYSVREFCTRFGISKWKLDRFTTRTPEGKCFDWLGYTTAYGVPDIRVVNSHNKPNLNIFTLLPRVEGL